MVAHQRLPPVGTSTELASATMIGATREESERENSQLHVQRRLQTQVIKQNREGRTQGVDI
jgi:hypothetical protein